MRHPQIQAGRDLLQSVLRSIGFIACRLEEVVVFLFGEEGAGVSSDVP